MIKYILKRPIGVLMIFLAIILVGIVSLTKIPVSLMPDIDIPEITIHIEQNNLSARELENVVVRPIRNSLLQLTNINQIETKTQNGYSLIKLRFNYGTDIDLAYIETNEKIDQSMQYLPKDIQRPVVVKASLSDIPIMYINVSLKDTSLYSTKKMLELSEFAQTVVRKRLEQLPQVAIVDITGNIYPEIKIRPYKNVLKSLNLTYSDIENIINKNNINLGNLIIKNGHYEYNVKFNTLLRTIEDIRNIEVNVNNRIVKLKDLAEIKQDVKRIKGLFYSEKKQAISIAVIKQSKAKTGELISELNKVVKYFNSEYKNLEFTVNRDQTKLLTLSINSLMQSLLIGSILSFALMFLFLKDFRSPFLIGISIPVALILSIIFLYLFKISINIISLSGLILGVGMMIDNSIIVIDNISQKFDGKTSLFNAVNIGTSTIITPLLSSVLTTSAVFIPLIFVSGIGGALFYDQALAVTIGLFSSLLVSIFLIPVLYIVFYKKRQNNYIYNDNWFGANLYQKGHKLIFNNKQISILIILFLIFSIYPLLLIVHKRKMPKLSRTETIYNINWGNNISIQSNIKRTKQIINLIDDTTTLITAEIGKQNYLLQKDKQKNINELSLYVKTNSTQQTIEIEKKIKNFLKRNYQNSVLQITNPDNIFEKLFPTSNENFIIKLNSRNNLLPPPISTVKKIRKELIEKHGISIAGIKTNKVYNIKINIDKLLLYNISYNSLYSKLKALFNENKIGVLKSFEKFIPITIIEGDKNISKILSQTTIKNTNGNYIPIKQLLEISINRDYMQLYGDKQGEYVPLIVDSEQEINTDSIKKHLSKYKNVDYRIHSEKDEQRDMFSQMLLILIISVLLLYFILATQFESLLQPIIILLEIPIDVAASIAFLYFFHSSLNIMSGIGIIVMTGIIINDSILKIDTINRLKKQGLETNEAIKLAGKKRLKPIIMTSLTTILALVPFLFSNSLGAELQKPLAIAVIGGMFVGTLVSLYVVPLFYWFIYDVILLPSKSKITN